jgi:Zn-dependent peptidase ImmA (M78 family)
MAKACRCPADKPSKPQTDHDWMEWQAEGIAAAILMPKDMFIARVNECKLSRMDKIKLRDGKIGFYRGKLDAVLATAFQVSKEAARIRLGQLAPEIVLL